MKVLHVIPGSGEGSSFIFSRRQAESVRLQNVETKIFFLRSRTHPVHLVREWRRLREVLRSFAPDVVHAHYGTVTSLLCVLSTRVPVIITFRGSDLMQGSLSPRVWLSNLFSQISALFASQLICVSEILRQHLWWRRGKAIILATGVNMKDFYPFPQAEAREILRLPLENKIILFNCGGQPVVKGQALALEAVHIAGEFVDKLQFLQLGGSIPPEIIPIYLNAADCLLVTSTRESEPLVVKEALACNLPVVSVDVGDVAVRLQGVYPSRVVPRNADALGQAIAEMIGLQSRSNGRSRLDGCTEVSVAMSLKAIYEAASERRAIAAKAAQTEP